MRSEGTSHFQELVPGKFAVGDDAVGMPQREPHRLVLAAPPPAGELLAVGIDDHGRERQARHHPCDQSFGQSAESMDGVECDGSAAATAT